VTATSSRNLSGADLCARLHWLPRWELSLAPGRTQELYTLESSDGITGGASSSMWRMRAPEKKQQGDSGDGGDRDATTTELSTQVVVNSLAGEGDRRLIWSPVCTC
jgi:hypothetical protein